MRKSTQVQLPKVKHTSNYKIQETPKKTLQTYIPISTWKKMLKRMEKTGETLSEINHQALESYLVS